MGVSSRGCCGVIAVAAVCSLIQSIIWLVLAVLAIMLRDCSLELNTEGPAYVLAMIYFYNEKCAPLWLINSGIMNDHVPPKTERTDAVALYFVISCALRAVAAAGLLVALVVTSGRGRGPSRTGVFFWAWALLSGGCLVGDLFCGIFYGTDLSDTDTIWKLLNVGVPSVIEGMGEYWALPLAPALMMLACLRFVVLWIPEAVLLPIAVRLYFKDREEEKWLMKTLSTSTPGGTTPPVAAPWVTNGSGIGPGADVVRRPGGGGDDGGDGRGGRNPQRGPYEYEEPNLEHLSVPADSQAWGGARPRESNWRGGAGPEQWGRQDAQGGPGLDRWNREGSGVGGPQRRHAPPPPLQLPRESAGPPLLQASPERMGAWDPRSPLQPPGAQTQQPFFGAPPPAHAPYGPPQHSQPTHSSFRSSQQTVPQHLPRPVMGPPVSGQPPGHAHAHAPAQRPLPSPEPGVGGENGNGRRYVEKLKDHDAERRRREAQKEAERRRRIEELQEEERRERDRALQEVADKAEQRRRRQAEAAAEGAARRAGPPVAPKPTIAGLQNQKPWSYVLPTRDNLPDRRPSPAVGDDDFDSDEGDMPPVPVQDYTLHIQRHNDRPALDTSRQD